MPLKTRYLLQVSMDVEPHKEDLFNEVYEEHVAFLMKVPGVVAVTRLVREPLILAIAGERKEMVAEGEPRYTAIYEIESPDVVVTDAWSEAVEKGRWGAEVRPYTHNRRHVLRKVIEPA
ncbi:MAG: hypothetical protein H6983_03340 [Ectothiorhodospiraceae bacterium]|nr:hypothetical protein [Ectothiorhodospiraceae bacterium]